MYILFLFCILVITTGIYYLIYKGTSLVHKFNLCHFCRYNLKKRTYSENRRDKNGNENQ